MAIGRISGPMLYGNLDRQGVNLAFDGTLLYLDVTNRYVGVNTSTPGYALDVVGTANVGNVITTSGVYWSNGVSYGSSFASTYGNTQVAAYLPIYTGNISAGNISVTKQVQANTLVTTSGVYWSNGASIFSTLLGNAITLGSNSSGALVSNAATFTTTTSVTDSIAQLNYVLGKLVPTSPPTFPGSPFTLAVNSLTSPGRMTNFTQTDNTGSGWSVAAGTTLANVLRTSTYTTNTITNVGPGNNGTVTVYFNGLAAGSNVLVGGVNATVSNLVILNNRDYNAVVSTVTPGFWYSFSAYASGSSVPSGYNAVYINDTAGSPTNTASWYYDSSAPGTPTFSNATMIVSANSVTYSSTIPHANGSSQYRLRGNIAKLSGDFYYSSDTFMTGTAGGAFQAPTSVTYTQAAVTTPLARNLHLSGTSAYFDTPASIIASGFGSSSTGPTLTAFNSYSSATNTYSPGVTILYKNGTGNNIEETSIPVTSVGTGSGNAYRIVNPGSTDTPVYTGSEAQFNSQTGPFYTYDATVVAAVLKYDTTNYSTGYFPVGPSLAGQGANQYFTFKFVRTVVSKFNITYTGTLAGLWVALPGSTIDSTSSLNGWIDVSVAYAGSGTPGANTGAGGNGSNGCAVGGVAVLNSAQTNKAVTATFGPVSSSSTSTNAIYVRVKLTSAQSLTLLNISTATN